MVYGLLPAEPACFVFLSSCRCSSNLGPTSGQNCLPTVSFTAVCRCDRISPFSGLESQHLDGPRAGMPAHQRRSSWTCDPIRAKLTAARLDFRLRSRQHYCLTKVFCQGSELSNARALVSSRIADLAETSHRTAGSAPAPAPGVGCFAQAPSASTPSGWPKRDKASRNNPEPEPTSRMSPKPLSGFNCSSHLRVSFSRDLHHQWRR